MAKADIEAVKAAHPILDVLRDLGIPVQHGRFRCLKPENHAHGDRTPSVSIRPDKGLFKCWVCPDVKGDVIDLVRLARNCSFGEALGFLGSAPVAKPAAAGPFPRAAEAVPRASSAPSFDPRGQSRLFPEEGLRGQAPDPARVPGPQAAGPRPPTDPSRGPGIDYVKSIHSPYIEAPGMSAPSSTASSSVKPGGPGLPHVSPTLPSGPALHPGSASRSGPALPSAPALPSEEAEAETEALRQRILAALLEACAPVGGAAGRYLAKRRIFKRTWEAQRLRMIDDYAGVSRKLEAVFGLDDLARMGFFNAAGHLRFYRHVLLFPYYDITGRAVYMQARAIDPAATGPKELSLAGHIPLPYNSRLLDGEPGQIYLCEGVIDTLTLIEQGFPAVGVPGAANFKAAWAPLFRNKTVHVAFDPDGPGESGAAKAIERLQAMGIEARRLAPPAGKDLNDWFRKG